jgi:glutathione synthase/RimK-type ligase-like ATP-grasp enzyme
MTEQRVLILSNSEDATSDYLGGRLEEIGIEFSRFDTDTDCVEAGFVFDQNGPFIEWKGACLRPEQVSTIILRRPKPIELGLGRDQHYERHASLEWSEGLEGFLAHIAEHKWINHPIKNCMASHKVEQLARARQFCLNVPDTLVTNSPSMASSFLDEKNGELVVKPIASGFIERECGDTLIYTNDFNESHREILEDLGPCPVMFQEKIVKDFDVRLTVLDGEMVAVGMKHQHKNGDQILDIRRNNMQGVQYFSVEVPPQTKSRILGLLHDYGLRFAAVDFGVTGSGEWVFFEINPNGQWAWLDLKASADIFNLFAQSLQSFAENVT